MVTKTKTVMVTIDCTHLLLLLYCSCRWVPKMTKFWGVAALKNEKWAPRPCRFSVQNLHENENTPKKDFLGVYILCGTIVPRRLIGRRGTSGVTDVVRQWHQCSTEHHVEILRDVPRASLMRDTRRLWLVNQRRHASVTHVVTDVSSSDWHVSHDMWHWRMSLCDISSDMRQWRTSLLTCQFLIGQSAVTCVTDACPRCQWRICITDTWQSI